MRLNRKEFAEAARLATRFTSPRSPLLPMQCLKLDAFDGFLQIESNCTSGSLKTGVSDVVGDFSGIVNAAAMCKTVGLFGSEEIDITTYKNKVRVSDGDYKIDMPSVSKWSNPSPPEEPTGSIVADGAEIARCLKSAVSIVRQNETRFVEGVRIHTDGGKLHFVSGTSAAQSFHWCNCDGSDIDVVVLKQAIPGICEAVADAGTVEVFAYESKVGFDSEKAEVLAPQAGGGQIPRTYSEMKSHWSIGNFWEIERGVLEEFCRHVAVFATEEANGVWMAPNEDGLLLEYTGVSDGTFEIDFSVDAQCQRLVEGFFEGDSVYLMNRLLLPAVQACTSETITICQKQNAVFVIDDSAVTGIGLMAKPSKDKQ